jgi:hypothetical protein
MADIYFCFSDECGDYKPNMTEKQLRNHPFYIRTTLIINAAQWKQLNNQFKKLKDDFGLGKIKEVKWAHIWTLRSFQKYNKPIPENHYIKQFEKFEYHTLIKFAEETLALLNNIDEKKIIATYTKNENKHISEKSMLAFHLQEQMQRIEMLLQVDQENLGVLFFDPVSPEKNEMFRQIYNSLFHDGDFIPEYKFIKDSLNIENSHHSVGIQIADFISGSFSAVLKHSDHIDYSLGISMFFNHVYPHIRRSPVGKIMGWGIREVPSSVVTRKWALEQLDKAEQSLIKF